MRKGMHQLRRQHRIALISEDGKEAQGSSGAYLKSTK